MDRRIGKEERMAEVSQRLIPIQWEGPMTLDDALKKSSNKDDYGIYQITGDHVVFGPGSLLYVGRARDQPFATRFAQHAEWLRHESGIAVRLGRIPVGHYETDPKGGWKDWSQLVTDVEALTIYWHAPPYNSQHIGSYKGQPLHVQCWGDRGRLLPEYSSHWRPLRPEDEPT
jgi:hypothetical protein